MRARYLVRPRADNDLDEQAYYLATKAGESGPALAHRFLGLHTKHLRCWPHNRKWDGFTGSALVVFDR